MKTKFKEVEKEIYELKVLLDGGYLNDNRRQKLKELKTLMDYAHSCEQLKNKETPLCSCIEQDNTSSNYCFTCGGKKTF